MPDLQLEAFTQVQHVVSASNYDGILKAATVQKGWKALVARIEGIIKNKVAHCKLEMHLAKASKVIASMDEDTKAYPIPPKANSTDAFQTAILSAMAALSAEESLTQRKAICTVKLLEGMQNKKATIGSMQPCRR